MKFLFFVLENILVYTFQKNIKIIFYLAAIKISSLILQAYWAQKCLISYRAIFCVNF